jgi:threonine dehydrogenase-like Zn-dependent dehydrogenase
MGKISEIYMVIHEALVNGAGTNDIVLDLVADYKIDRAFAIKLVTELEQQYYEEMENGNE